MAKQYQWQVSMDAVGPIAAGVLSGDTSLHTTDVLSGTSTAQYYYLDSNVVTSGTANTSRVVIQESKIDGAGETFCDGGLSKNR
jgi:hypothetical protein